MPREQVLMIDCAGVQLPGVVSDAAQAADTGVIIVVGGPQYRAGSHRQFVLAARSLAQLGFTTLRFDVRGMGDSAGEPRSFEQLDEDIRAAIDGLLAARPLLRRVVLYGLCDGASAALLYCERTRDRRVAGLCLLNPWLRSSHTLARTQIRHYYLQRLGEPAFWAKLLSGGVAREALRELLVKLRSVARGAAPAPGPEDFRCTMAAGWARFEGPILLLLSGEDLTAREFETGAGSDPAWSGALSRVAVKRVDFAAADHTFSRMKDRLTMESAVGQWLHDTFDTQSISPDHQRKECHV